MSNPVPSDSLKSIIQDGDAQELVKQAEKLGQKFGRKTGRESPVTTNQIRAIFGTVRQIEMNWPILDDKGKKDRAERSLMLLKPKVVYRAARERTNQELKEFAQVVTDCIDLVLASGGDTRQRFGYFVDFFEAMMAYHKAASEGF